MLITVAELAEYQKRAQGLLLESERLDIVNYVAAYPKAGDLIVGTGWRAQAAVAPWWFRQEWRRARDLLLP